MSSSSTICSQGAVLATAMAVSGTVILLAIRLHKFQFPLPSHQLLRPCLSSSGEKKEEEEKKNNNKKKKKKRVHFAEDVVEPRGDGERFRRKQAAINISGQTSGRKSPPSSPPPASFPANNNKKKNKERGMPANRVALYNGILRDRLVQRLAYSC